jgi:uncharacterized RDD family membrane protein YckC
MAAAPQSTLASPTPAEPAAHVLRPVAQLHARVTAYLIDSLVLLAFVLIFFVAGGAVLLFSSDLGRQDPPDSAYYAFAGVFLGGTLAAWSAFNLALMRWRGQTAGMYFVGLRAVGEDRSRLTLGQLVLRWLALHPLVFHPFLLPVWGIFSLLAVSITLSNVVLIITLVFVLLCVVAPLASLAHAAVDPQRRVLADRVARALVVRAGP